MSDHAVSSKIETLLGMARTAEAGQNPQEAERYYTQVLELEPTLALAWFGKGKAAGWQSTINHIRLPETQAAFINALANTPEGEKEEMLAQCMNEMNVLVSTIYGMARKHMLEFVALPQTWIDYINQVGLLLHALDEISIWNPSDRTTLENIVHLCKDNIEGVTYRDQFDNNTPKGWQLSPEYETLMRDRMQAAAHKIQQLDSEYKPPTAEAKKPDNCFVVTATMGDVSHPTVLLMREFRDQWLLCRKWGNIFVRHYYEYGPNAARLISRSRRLRFLSYACIVVPAAWIAKRLLQRSRSKSQ